MVTICGPAGGPGGRQPQRHGHSRSGVPGITKSDGSGLVLVSTFANGKWYQTDNDIGGQWSLGPPALAALNNTVNCAWYDKNANGELKWAQKPLGAIFPDHWMKEIDDSTKLSALTIPGTHDTCTYTSKRPWVSTQVASVPQQLDEGIRFLDLRCGLDGGVLYMYHTATSSCPGWVSMRRRTGSHFVVNPPGIAAGIFLGVRGR